MRIAILSRNENLYSTRRLKEAGISRGHEVEVIDYLRCYMNITSKNPTIHYKGKILDKYDVVLPRIGAKRTFYGTAILRQFETMGTYTVNKSIAISRSRDKLRSLQLLAMEGIGMPITGFAHDPNDTDDLIEIAGGNPLVVKLIEGTQGVGVVLAETKKAAESVIQAFRGLNANIIVQEFIKESKAADVRCLVVDNKVIAAVKRQGLPGEFRSNLHRGGIAKLIKINKEEKTAAIKATKVLGLNVAGVDLLQSDRGPLVMEVNSSPGLEGIENATNIDAAGKIIEFIEKVPMSNKGKGKFQG